MPEPIKQSNQAKKEFACNLFLKKKYPPSIKIIIDIEKNFYDKNRLQTLERMEMEIFELISLVLAAAWIASFLIDWMKFKIITIRSWLLILTHLIFASAISLLHSQGELTPANAGILASTICFTIFVFNQIKSRRKK